MRRRRYVTYYPLFDGAAGGQGGAGDGNAAGRANQGENDDDAFVAFTCPLSAAQLAALQAQARIAAAILWSCRHPERFPNLIPPPGQ